MDCLAALFASHIKAGDCYCLSGAVGAGKSVFSRAFIRAVAEDDFLPVPSPTFLLQNTYEEHHGPPIHHFDFYRLTSAQDFNRLDLEGSLTRAVCLMEWPERLPALPAQYLAVHIEVVDELPPQAQHVMHTSVHDEALQQLLELRRSFTSASDDSDSDGDPYCLACSCRVPEDVGSDSNADDFTDRRPRLVTLTPHGSYWEGKARRIVSYIAAHVHACGGLVVLQGASEAEQESAAAGSSAASFGGSSAPGLH